jgi:hypothetical protein
VTTGRAFVTFAESASTFALSGQNSVGAWEVFLTLAHAPAVSQRGSGEAGKAG